MDLFVFGRHPFSFDAIFPPEEEGFESKEFFLRHLGRCVNTFKVRKVPQTVYELHENRSVSRFYRINLNEQSKIVITDSPFHITDFLAPQELSKVTKEGFGQNTGRSLWDRQTIFACGK